MTQSALAQAAQVQPTAIAQWESGRRVPQVEASVGILDVDTDHYLMR